MYIYRAFGLLIASKLEIKDLIPEQSKDYDVYVDFGPVPNSIDNIIMHRKHILIGRNQMLLEVTDVARFYVANGNLIIVEPYEAASMEQVKLYLLGSCIGAILFQRGIVPLHGSCLKTGDNGLILTGRTGAGKSTIAAALMREGYELLTDDVAAVAFDEALSPRVYSSYPTQKLWQDAIRRLDKENAAMKLIRNNEGRTKYLFTGINGFCTGTVRLKTIVEIIPMEACELRLDKIQGMEKISIIMKNTYRRFMTIGFDIRQWHFESCLKIATDTNVYRIIRPKDEPLEKEIAHRLLEQLNYLKEE